jgi:uncharacterized membrane protein
MINQLGTLISSPLQQFKKHYYGRTFRCPVCHLELAYADADGNNLVVCPLCGVVIDIEEVLGHAVPVVHSVECNRPQPWARLHPMAAHLPIGLFPFAVVGAFLLFAYSLVQLFWSSPPRCLQPLVSSLGLVENAVLLLLVLSVAGSLLTFASGVWDWRQRYRARRYRQISLKIACSIGFVICGAVAGVLHAFGLVFPDGSGMMQLGSPLNLAAGLLYLFLLLVSMALVATLGHIGGNLVFGR